METLSFDSLLDVNMITRWDGVDVRGKMAGTVKVPWSEQSSGVVERWHGASAGTFLNVQKFCE